MNDEIYPNRIKMNKIYLKMITYLYQNQYKQVEIIKR